MSDFSSKPFPIPAVSAVVSEAAQTPTALASRPRRLPEVTPTRARSVELAQPEPARALAALARSVQVAEGAAPEIDYVVVRPADLVGLSRQELRPGLDQLLCASHADDGLDSLLDTGLLECLLPEVGALVGFGDGEWRHKDVWKHTKQVVIQAVPRVELRWSALLHDIGKVKTRSISESGEVHFFGHAEVGARMFDRLERRVALFAADDALRTEIRFLVLHHLRAGCYDGSWTDSAVRRFTREMGPYLEDLLLLSRADMTTKRPEKKRQSMRMLKELSDRIEELNAQDARVPPLPKGLGDELMRVFGIPPSRQLGSLMRALETLAGAGEIESHRDADYYIEVIAKDRLRFGLAEG